MQSVHVLLFSMMILVLGFGSVGCEPGQDGAEDPLAGTLPADAPLVPADHAAFVAYMKTALTSTAQPSMRLTLDAELAPVAAPQDDGSSSESNGADDTAFSTTNLQTRGVDESDTVRFDGEFLYIARPAKIEYRWPVPVPVPLPEPRVVPLPGEAAPALVSVEDADARYLYPEIEVIEPAHVALYRATNDPAAAESVGRIPLKGAVDIRGLLTLPSDGDDPALLVVVSTENSQVSYAALDFWDPWYHSAGKVHVEVFDVSDPLDAQSLFDWRFDGLPLATRRVGDQLILVTTYAPYLRALSGLAGDDEERDRRVEEARVEDLLPRSWVGDDEVGDVLVPAERCFVPATEADPTKRLYPIRPTLATIAMLDLRDLADLVTVCAAGPVDRVFTSTESVYLASTDWGYADSATTVHKFALSRSGPRFRGSARVPGRPTGSQPGFGLGEHDGALGILTAENAVNDEGGFEQRHRLTLLRESGSDVLRLEEAAHLPNESEPAPIGKPDEQVYGVRFAGDRVYVVTFRRIDPLYVIDIADAGSPFIAGELELPGFSDYLQPIGSDLLLGVGMASIPGSNGADFFQGVKVELFDVEDPSQPATLDSIEIGLRGSSTSARTDHQAVNWIDLGDGQLRVTVPVAVHEEDAGGPPPTGWHGWSRTALQLLEVDVEAKQLSLVGEVVAESIEDEEPIGWGQTYGDRARLQGDAVHYIHGGEVWSAPWFDPEDTVGPQ